MKETTDADFTKFTSTGKVLVDFWASWCGPCKALAPTLEELSTEYTGKVSFIKINVDENQETAKTFGIRGLPTVVLMENGKALESIVGLRSKQEYVEALAKTLDV
jgi:thioredoxin 1